MTHNQGEHYISNCTSIHPWGQSEFKWSMQNFEVGQAVKQSSKELGAWRNLINLQRHGQWLAKHFVYKWMVNVLGNVASEVSTVSFIS